MDAESLDHLSRGDNMDPVNLDRMLQAEESYHIFCSSVHDRDELHEPSYRREPDGHH